MSTPIERAEEKVNYWDAEVQRLNTVLETASEADYAKVEKRRDQANVNLNNAQNIYQFLIAPPPAATTTAAPAGN